MAIEGKKRTPLTRENILKLISPYDVYRFYLGDFKLNNVINNSFRGDRNPSLIIGTKYGEITHHDFADNKWNGDCFAFVQQIHGCDYDMALKIIDRDMGLNILAKGGEKYKEIVKQYKQPEELGKRYSLIQCITRPYTKEELSYWNEYFQDVSDLRTLNIYSIKKAYLNKQLFTIKDTELRFGYLYGSYWKLYFPFREKKNKWVSNVPLSTSWGINNLDRNHNSLIAKSLKDYAVCRKVLPHVCGVQNESLAAFSHETIYDIKENSKEVYYGGDSDKAGKEASYAITDAYGFKHINPPDVLLKECCKDWAEMGKQRGLNSLEEHFIKKKLL